MTQFRQPFKNEWPITQRYGETFTSTFHTGIDYGCPMGTPILASADGLVVYAGEDSTGYGKLVIVKHYSGVSTLYAHLSDIYVHVNQTLKQSNVIGLSGSTGYSTGPHLHFEARRQWNDFHTHFDPMKLPLTSVIDISENEYKLHDDFKTKNVKIICSDGAFGHNDDFSDKRLFHEGTKFTFTGEKIERNGLIFCKCIPEPVWIAANDGITQILENY